jgi:hypothetical protein
VLGETANGQLAGGKKAENLASRRLGEGQEGVHTN